MEVKMKGRMLLVLAVAVVISTLSIVSMIRSNDVNSLQSYLCSIECNAQGDFMPEPYDSNLMAPAKQTDDKLCVAQGDIKPSTWEKINN